LRRREPEVVRAVDGVSFSLERGEVLAIVGESGCGKTTIARTLIGLEARDGRHNPFQWSTNWGDA
jgi:ABC-type oligopeptide transport system ATPase subunit